MCIARHWSELKKTTLQISVVLSALSSMCILMCVIYPKSRKILYKCIIIEHHALYYFYYHLRPLIHTSCAAIINGFLSHLLSQTVYYCYHYHYYTHTPYMLVTFALYILSSAIVNFARNTRDNTCMMPVPDNTNSTPDPQPERREDALSTRH